MKTVATDSGSSTGPLTNWAGNLAYRASRTHRPQSLDALRRLVADSPRIRALGSGHSFSGVADSTGELVLMDRLPGEVRIDPDGPTAEVPAGMRYAELARHLHRKGWALANLASLPHISVAGSVATGTHGSGRSLRGLGAAVSALRLIGPQGDLIELRRDGDGALDRDFDGAVVALGALGVVERLTLDIEPAYRMAQQVRQDVPLDEVAARLDQVLGAAYSVSVFTDWHGPTAEVWLKRRIGAKDSGWSGGRAATEPAHPVPGMPADSSTEQLGVPGAWFERLPHFRPELTPGAGDELQSEYFLPSAAAPAAISELRAIGGRLAPVLHIAEVRAVRGDALWLSPAYGRDSVTFHFTWYNDAEAIRPVLAAVEERLVPLGARPHWGKLTGLAPAEIAAAYSRAGDFRRLRRILDPKGKFGNPFVDALFPIDGAPNEPA